MLNNNNNNNNNNTNNNNNILYIIVITISHNMKYRREQGKLRIRTVSHSIYESILVAGMSLQKELIFPIFAY